MATILNLADADFAASVSEGITVVDFWAGRCGPCRAMAPQFERAAQLRPGYRFAKVDVDAAPNVCAAFGIRSIPTVMVLHDGAPIAAQAGLVGADQLVEAVDRLAAQTESEAA